MDNQASVEAKLEILERAVAKAKQIQTLMKELDSEIISEFEVKLPGVDTTKVVQGVTSLHALYQLLKLTRGSVNSTSTGFFSILPVELVMHIFSFLSPISLCYCSRVNWDLKRLSEETRLWRNICRKFGCEVFWRSPDGVTPDDYLYYKNAFKWYFQCDRKVTFSSTGLQLPNHSSPEVPQAEDRERPEEITAVQAEGPFEVRRGKEIYSDGSIYRGEWLIDAKGNGKRNGLGIQRWAEKDIYKGEWCKDKRTGYGVHIWPDDHYYEGYYLNDKRNGMGVFKWPDGREYRGNYSEDQRNGHGEFIWPNGDRYTGNYENSNRNGYGVFSWADGRKYDGEWRDGGYHGKGQYTHRDKSNYTGQWRDNLRHGRGIFRWIDGDWYSGEWVEGRRWGLGTLHRTNGTKIDQYWEEGDKFDKHKKGIPEDANYVPKKRKLEEEGDEDEHESKKQKMETIVYTKPERPDDGEDDNEYFEDEDEDDDDEE